MPVCACSPAQRPASRASAVSRSAPRQPAPRGCVALGLALLAVVACWPSPTDTGFHSNVLVVEVREADGTPVANVNLTLRVRDAAPEAPAVAQRRTDAEGRADFGEHLGAFEIQVSVPAGFELAAAQANPVFVGVEEGRGEKLVPIVLRRLTPSHSRR